MGLLGSVGGAARYAGSKIAAGFRRGMRRETPSELMQSVGRKGLYYGGSAAVLGASIFASGADAQTTPTYVTDIGIDATDVATALTTALAPFIIAAIGVGFGIYAVFRGFSWFKRMGRG